MITISKSLVSDKRALKSDSTELLQFHLHLLPINSECTELITAPTLHPDEGYCYSIIAIENKGISY